MLTITRGRSPSESSSSRARPCRDWTRSGRRCRCDSPTQKVSKKNAGHLLFALTVVDKGKSLLLLYSFILACVSSFFTTHYWMTRLTRSQLWSFKMRRTTFPNYMKSADVLILTLKNCERAGRAKHDEKTFLSVKE